jgi:UrcA family protein
MCRRLTLKIAIPCTLLAILAGPVSAVAAIAEQSDDPPTRVVKFGDLDLSRSEAAAALYSRIDAAAREVCQPVNIWALKLLVQSSQCRHHAIAQAVADVNSSTLTKYYETKTYFGIRDAAQR